MNRQMVPAVLFLSLCELLAAQQSRQATSPITTSQLALLGQETAGQQTTDEETADMPQPSAVAERALALKNARTMCITSGSAFLTVSTMERALMRQKGWDHLDLSIIGSDRCSADLKLAVDRLIFTHIHTYVLTDERTGIVLASGRVTAFDGIVASGPMAEQIVKILSAARLPASAPAADRGL